MAVLSGRERSVMREVVLLQHCLVRGGLDELLEVLVDFGGLFGGWARDGDFGWHRSRRAGLAATAATKTAATGAAAGGTAGCGATGLSEAGQCNSAKDGTGEENLFLHRILVQSRAFHLKHSPPLRAAVGPRAETVTEPGLLGFVAR